MSRVTCALRRAALRCLLALFPLVLHPSAIGAQEQVEINMRRVSDRVLVTWGCDYFQGTNMAVIATAKGLVIIDTGLSPTTVRRQRELVEKELGRGDFRVLINTHMHNDHAFANEVFPEATVVGPEHGAAALRREVELIPELLDRLRRSRESYREWVAETSPDSAEGKEAREGVAAFGVGIVDLERGIEPRYPTSTFRGHRTLDMGDIHIELFEFTGLHSSSDILIVVPEEHIVFTGDALWGGRLPILQVTSLEEHRRLLEHWGAVLERWPDLELVIPGHSDVPMSIGDLRGMYAYLSRLTADVRAARASGGSVLRFLTRTSFAERYPEVADFGHTLREINLHQHNVYTLWHLGDGGAS